MSETNKNAPAQQNNESKKPSVLGKVSDAGNRAAEVASTAAVIFAGLAKFCSFFDKDKK